MHGAPARVAQLENMLGVAKIWSKKFAVFALLHYELANGVAPLCQGF